MSFRSLLVHRCDLYDLVTNDQYGSPVTSYQKITPKPIPCRLDLNFIRQGKDAQWVAAAARPEDRMGIMFFLPSAPIQSGMRLVMARGPKGTFQIKGAIDEAWDFDSLDHYEVGVMEVSSLIARDPFVQVPGQV